MGREVKPNAVTELKFSLGKDEVYRHKIMALTIMFRILDFIMSVIIC